MPSSNTTCPIHRNPITSEETPAVGITIDGLTKNFGDLHVLKNVSFNVEPGEIFVLMGPSGSGKSVLLKHIVGLEAPTSGRVLIDGRNVAAEDTLEHVRIALVFQAGALFNSLSVYENLALYPREHRLGNESEIREKVTRALQILSLENTAQKFPSELSGGMKKRAGLARAIALDPELLFLDEPTAGLDPIGAAAFDQLILDLQKALGLTVFMVTHDLDSLHAICDRIAVLAEKKVLCVGDIPFMLSQDQPWIREYFHGPRGRAAGVAGSQPAGA